MRRKRMKGRKEGRKDGRKRKKGGKEGSWEGRVLVLPRPQGMSQTRSFPFMWGMNAPGSALVTPPGDPSFGPCRGPGRGPEQLPVQEPGLALPGDQGVCGRLQLHRPEHTGAERHRGGDGELGDDWAGD
ncbi:uncharacterized protein LOC100554201 [Anolis carolinensis]|uniref:uncharacterized protein LOC100554201 n=1 Tax=Anolis carolinensis TaxID=28377 RepID=UPI002F2B5C28